MTERTVCFSCSQQRKELKIRQSTIMDNISLIMCNICFAEGYEPRWVVMIALGQLGPTEPIKKIVHERKYHGEEITLSEYLNVDK